MLTVIAIGLLGGLITGISPCILPVLPVIFFSGTQSGPTSARRPYLVIAGLVLSFTAVTLTGSAVLSLLNLPQDALRWVALAALTAIGIGLIFPRFEAILEKPFARLPQRQFGSGTSGFGLGLALGVLYVPRAGAAVRRLTRTAPPGEHPCAS